MKKNGTLFLLLIILLGLTSCATAFKKIAGVGGCPEIGPASFSPTGKEIVFSAKHRGVGNIYKVKLDETNSIVTLSGYETYDFGPVFSPDGTSIVFLSNTHHKEADLCLMKSDGSGKTFLTSGPEHDYCPVFSPDGAKIYFLRAKWFGNYSPIALPTWHKIDIYSINVDGTNLTRLTHEDYSRGGSLSINPDGTVLMATIGRDFGIRMRPIENPSSAKSIKPNLRGNKLKLALSGGFLDYKVCHSPKFSPDKKHMLFISNGQIYLMDLETESAQEVMNLKTLIEYASFSPDGTEIVFTSNDLLSHPNHPVAWNSYVGPRLWIVNMYGLYLKEIKLQGLPCDD